MQALLAMPFGRMRRLAGVQQQQLQSASGSSALSSRTVCAASRQELCWRLALPCLDGQVLTGAVCCRNVAGAERTLQKQLSATRDSADSVRPDFQQRLTGTLADVIARAAQQDAAAGKHSQTDRMPEIIEHLQSAFDVRPMAPCLATLCS